MTAYNALNNLVKVHNVTREKGSVFRNFPT